MKVREAPSALFVWCIGFAYATVVALAFQKLVLPLMPGLHAQYGLLQNDAIQFHLSAVAMAEKIRAVGWSAWHLYPENNYAGNVGLLGALYALFGPDPAWFIPINAAAHALGGAMLYRMGRLLWPGAVGVVGGLVAAIAFIGFPSSLQWYGQNHRDAFAIAGTFLLLYPYLELWSLDATPSRTFWKRTAMSTLCGMLLVVFVRPHLFQILAAGFAAAWGVIFLRVAFRRDLRRKWAPLAVHAFLICAVAAGSLLIPRDRNFNKIVDQPTIGGEEAAAGQRPWEWHPSRSLPKPLDHVLQQISVIRAHFAYEGRFAGSLEDGARIPDDAASAAAYAPRAFVVGLLAPFPDTWTIHPTAVRLVGAIETFVWYLLAAGIAVLVWYHRSDAFLVGLAFACVLLTILGYTYPVVGTLYRERYGIWMFIALFGTLGWSLVLTKMLAVTERAGAGAGPEAAESATSDAAAPVRAAGMSGVAAAGAAVLIITFLTFLGFVIRDLTLVKTFGMTAELGGFFSAAMLPMFFVSFLSFPFADSMTKPFLELDAPGRRQLVRSLLGVACLLLFGTGAVVLCFAERIVAVVMSSADAAQIAEAASMLRCFTPILMFSGWTVIGNAVLNLNARAREAALAQMSVPALAVAAIWVFHESWGVYAAVAGMLAGMAANIALVAHLARGLGISLVPAMRPRTALGAVLGNYASLAVAAVFSAAIVPLNYAFAGTLDGGSISIWALGAKIVQLVSGMAGIAVSAVVLPHLGSLVAGRRSHQLGNDTFFLLAAGTWIAIVCAIGIDLFAEPVVVLMLEGGKITHEQSLQLAGILSFGALQLPAVIASALILKVAAVSGSSRFAVLAAGAGFVVNAAGDWILTPMVGLLGIAISSAAGASLSAALLMLLTRKRSGMALSKILAVFSAWVVMVGISVSVHFHSSAALTATLIAFGVVAWATWRQVAENARSPGMAG
jgi:peptidoglycan biosynthesis protein MviN/MurJ (putative lipid II flippase)